MAMKGYSIFPRSKELEPHYLMQFSGILRTRFVLQKIQYILRHEAETIYTWKENIIKMKDISTGSVCGSLMRRHILFIYFTFYRRHINFRLSFCARSYKVKSHLVLILPRPAWRQEHVQKKETDTTLYSLPEGQDKINSQVYAER